MPAIAQRDAREQRVHQRHEERIARSSTAAVRARKPRAAPAAGCRATESPWLRAPAPFRPSPAGRNASTRVRARRGHHDETLGPRRARRARKGQHVVEVHLAEGLLASPPASAWCRGSRRPRGRCALQLRLELVELDDAVGEAGVLAPERTAGNGVNAGEVRCIQQASSTYPPTRPLAPASSATLGSESAMGRLDCVFVLRQLNEEPVAR